jgi:hypothetical protein
VKSTQKIIVAAKIKTAVLKAVEGQNVRDRL